MQVDDLSARLEEAATISNQRDRIQSYFDLLELLLSNKSADGLIAFGRHFVTSTSMAMVVGRRVLGAYVTSLTYDLEGQALAEEDTEKWKQLGRSLDDDTRKAVIEGALDGDLAGWCEEQTTALRHGLSSLLQAEEDWLGAARALMKIPLDGSSRLVSDEEKLQVYLKIVRLLLECGESAHAQTYFSRASLLIHNSNDKETVLAYRLSQARLLDYATRFTEASQKYHEVSLNPAIDEGDRLQMLSCAVITCILAPAGPQRMRLLGSLNRDDRVANLPSYLGSMLRKMLLEFIVRPEEVHEFEGALQEHQKALVEGGGTVLERAVREHNVGACAKVYDNIGFESLGELLGTDAGAAEAMARRMIEQGRLRAWIDQPDALLFFESRENDDDGQGTAGGLGVEKVEMPVLPVSWTERWDARIRDMSLKVERLAGAISEKGLVQS